MVQSVCVWGGVPQEEELRCLRESVEAVDQNRRPLRAIQGYSILDHLGSGAFGSVFKVQDKVPNWADIVGICFPFKQNNSAQQVRKLSGQNLLALKEVNLHNPAFGKDKRSRDSNVEKILSELAIVKEQAWSGDSSSKVPYCASLMSCVGEVLSRGSKQRAKYMQFVDIFSCLKDQCCCKLGKIWDLHSVDPHSHAFLLFLMFSSVLLQLKHPNVVKYYKTFLEGEEDFLLRPLFFGHLDSPKSSRRLLQVTSCTW